MPNQCEYVWEIIHQYERQKEYINEIQESLNAMEDAGIDGRIYSELKSKYEDEKRKMENFKKLQVEVK
jgi:hypothetical protein